VAPASAWATGRRSPCCTALSRISLAEELHAQIPGAELVVVSGAGHQVNMEAPERFDAELRPFVSAS
jgi:pimeloyl-ACP methyl ester carboxylesterase